MTVDEREEMAERLASQTAPWLTYAVHRRDADMIAATLDGLSRQELLALAVVLAARCPRPLVRPDDGVVDEIAVARAAAGERIPLTIAERVEAARRLARQGHGPIEVARRLRVAPSVASLLLKKAKEGAAA